MSLRHDMDGKVLDLALRLWLVRAHDEWGDDAWEPLPEAMARWGAVFGPEPTEHFGDCTGQPQTCERCLRDEYVLRAMAQIRDDAL